MSSQPFDIAPFALPNSPRSELRFEEPRDIVEVVVDLPADFSEGIGLSYLGKAWPLESRAEDWETAHPGNLGWVAQDDWFNVEWRTAKTHIQNDGDGQIRIRFAPISAEFPELTDYEATFRRTLGIRIDGVEADAIGGVRVFTASAPTRTALRFEFDAGKPTPADAVRLEGHNLEIEEPQPDQGFDLSAAPRSPVTVVVRHMAPAHSYCGDEGLLTVFLEEDAFTVSLDSLFRQGPVWTPDFGVFITRDDDPTTFSDYLERQAGTSTIAAKVTAHAEQSLAGAFHGQPRPHSVATSVGCPRARQRFWIEANGDVVLHKRNVTWVEGKDTERYKSRGDARFFFGLEDWTILARFPDPAPVLACNTLARRGALSLEQKVFAAPLTRSFEQGDWTGDDTMVALVRLRFHNEGDVPAPARWTIRYSQESSRSYNRFGADPSFSDALVPRSPMDTLQIRDRWIESPYEGVAVSRCSIETGMSVQEAANAICLDQSLQPGETCEAVLRIPYVALQSPDEAAALASLDFESLYAAAQAYWCGIGRHGAQMQTPESQLEALHAAHLSHVLITDFEMPDGSGLINTSVGTSTYGNFTNESCMIVHELDQRGLTDEARKRIDLWVRYQGTVPQPGNFTDCDGMFYGAGGFECGAYNQHHGWALWRLADHYLMTRDDAWFARVADSLIAGADWVFRQRRHTMVDLPHSRGWEHGFLPAGSLEDVTDFYYWLSTNSLTWRGVEWAARALGAAHHPEASRLRREADAYRDDLVRGFETMRKRSPLVRLRDGRWVPHYPSRLYRRGREVGWIRETLEGAVYLLISDLYSSHGREAEWILDDFHDTRYIEPPYGYEISDFDMTWFDRGGFSMQPNLLAGLIPHLDRDEIEVFLWMFYNAWRSCYNDEINAMVEHPLPVLGWANSAHFKTSDQANAIMWLRLMFVYATDDLLHLGRAIPRAWFAQERPFETTGVATHFGQAGVRYEPMAAEKTARATAFLQLDAEPRQTLIRFRDHEKRPLRDVRVNGCGWTRFDAISGDIDITGESGEVVVEVAY